MASCGMDFDFHRLLFPASSQQNHNKVDGKDALISPKLMASVGTRLPLHPRHPNRQHHLLPTGTTHSATTATNSCSGEDGSSTSSKEGSNSNAAVLNRLSSLESSDNEKNKGMLPSSFSSKKSFSDCQQQQQHQPDNFRSSNNRGNVTTTGVDSSTITHTGAANAPVVMEPCSRQKALLAKAFRGRSLEPRQSTLTRASSVPQVTVTGAAEASAMTNAAVTATTIRTVVENAVAAAAAASSDDSVVIEEKRRRVDGEGYTVHQYLRGRLLGKGGFAKVYLCTALDTNKAYAVKIVPKANLVKARARQKLQAEIKIHRTLKHKHICEYKHFFEDRDNCYILLELCHNQSMNEMLKRRKRLTEPEAQYFLEQLLQAVSYMHENCVIHRDLKLGNLFLDRHLEMKVGDLGLATKLTHAEEKRKTICGTPNYIAPEVIQGSKETRGHSFEVDIWSVGVILYTLLIGKPPYEAKDVKSTYQRIIANEYSFPPTVPISDHAKDLIASMLKTKPEDRPKLPDIARHPFLTASILPTALPQNATHVAPEWYRNEYGEIATEQEESASQAKKVRSVSRNRRPFMSRDLNVERAKHTNAFDEPMATKKQSDYGDACGEVRHPIAAPTTNAAEQAPSAHFPVYDEAEQMGLIPFKHHPSQLRPTPTLDAEAEMIARTATLSLRQTYSHSMGAPSNEASHLDPFTTTPGTLTGNMATKWTQSEAEMLILKQMYERLETVIDVTESRKFAYNPISATSRPVPRGAPNKWVVRYVDYTSKYGLGFLLNDGSSGVYFNDSTKAVLETEGEVFQYVDRQRIPVDPNLGSGSRRIEQTSATYTLSSFPKNLQKKVTLLKHFRNYLIEQQKKADDDEDTATNLDIQSAPLAGCGNSSAGEMIFLKKWFRTKHAMLFRLSDQTVQIVFCDQTEVLLTPEERFITFVDKTRMRNTYFLSDELVGCNEALAKRLKYCRDILQQLIMGPPR